MLTLPIKKKWLGEKKGDMNYGKLFSCRWKEK